MMNSILSVKFWGVRGSLPSAPTPDSWIVHIAQVIEEFQKFQNLQAGQGKKQATVADFLKTKEIPHVAGYGTATTSVEVTSHKTKIIIDGGSGIRNLSEQIMRGANGPSKGPHHIFMTHFHWDHVIGLPFFAPHFLPGSEIHYYAVQPDLEKLIRGVFEKPYFPVPFEKLPAKIHFHTLQPRQSIRVEDLNITPYQLDHPDDCWGFRIECGGKVYSHCIDTEGTRVSVADLGPDLPLYQNSDLMYFDAQYTLPELAEKANWGHSASQVGLDIAVRERIKRVIFAHHDPGAPLDQILNLKRQTQEYHQWLIQQSDEIPFEVEWDFAYEGLTIAL